MHFLKLVSCQLLVRNILLLIFQLWLQLALLRQLRLINLRLKRSAGECTKALSAGEDEMS